MLQLRDKKIRIFLIVMLVVLLASVRAFESVLFYDPFYDYFQSDYLNGEFPKYDGIALFAGLAFRYFLNTAFSLAIIQLLFLDRSLTKFAGLLYVVLFIMLIIAFFLLLGFCDSSNNFVLFYVRRFLIQPILLFIFIAAFYYQKQQLKK
jgi:exosortase F-associated protein